MDTEKIKEMLKDLDQNLSFNIVIGEKGSPASAHIECMEIGVDAIIVLRLNKESDLKTQTH